LSGSPHHVLDLLACPHCTGDMALDINPTQRIEDEIIEGTLTCASCSNLYPITNGIPRFVKNDENYAKNFGFQWHKFRETQIDRFGNHKLSGSRLLKDTKWSPEFIQGKIILDAGCGAGRFADELAQNGAKVIACDISGAVDACKKTVDDPHGYSPNRVTVTVIQANLLALPFKQNVFDAIHCADVIQHTPDPSKIM
jgi:2-polyprenyl-3-methyl-5-hydroxy-6-metoxy-1,4-benzoquinol methylase